MTRWYMTVNQPGGGASIPFDPRDVESAQGAVLIAEALLKEQCELDPNRRWSAHGFYSRSQVFGPVYRGGWMSNGIVEEA